MAADFSTNTASISEELFDNLSKQSNFTDKDNAFNPSVQSDVTHSAELLVNAMNNSPFIKYIGLVFSYEDGQFVGRIDNMPALVGNTNFRILHGGVAATVLDSIGGLIGMLEIYRRDNSSLEEKNSKAKRMATVDLRIDYLAPGRGKQFIATGEVIRMGRKGCTTRMMLRNEEGKPIAHGIASYAY